MISASAETNQSDQAVVVVGFKAELAMNTLMGNVLAKRNGRKPNALTTIVDYANRAGFPLVVT